uniref:Plant heme peroxidase family profile domain-containing protein n=1 Tax=Oryza punctata TaxID=4537 RepID=A0A0E0JHF0_ORYPU
MKVFVVVCMLAVAFRIAAAVVVPSPAPYALSVGFYNGKCGNVSVESIVYDTVKAFLDADKSKGAALVRFYVVPAVGGDFLDNSYYKNNKNNLVLFHSDWALVSSNATLQHVNEYAENGTLWNIDFGEALVKLSKLAMPAGSVGQIRKTCRAINY